ncbi:hypothetical protein BX265_0292 [Streptomyces sp. TLI_235]|nr:hypothetical protein BX265_0292 [Streptomyces sp. TLI_235]
MRSIPLPKPLLAAAFGCVVLSACAPRPGGHRHR